MPSRVERRIWKVMVPLAVACGDKDPPTGGGNNTPTLTARHGHAMVYDEARRRLLLYGGQSGTFPNLTVLSDTWEWDGPSWTRSSVSGPAIPSLSDLSMTRRPPHCTCIRCRKPAA
jgi:hypothetical protein